MKKSRSANPSSAGAESVSDDPVPANHAGDSATARTLAPIIAAVDLGSNSFHMVLGRVAVGHLVILDRLREMARLAAGLESDGTLSQRSQTRALECLERFGQRLHAMPKSSVRAVGTNTLRLARNSDEFLAKAEAALGHPIEIISALEEARLVYQGVASDLAEDGERRLVIDVGGGSTELIIGERLRPMHCSSLQLGCVSLSRSFFADGTLSKKRIQQARRAAVEQIEPVASEMKKLGWKQVIGSSGTMRAVERVVRHAGWSKVGVTKGALERLEDALEKAGSIERLQLEGLSGERRPVFPGGALIVSALFEVLDLEVLRASDGALREGLLYEMTGLHLHRDEDGRDRTVQSLAERHHVDLEHARRVEATARHALKEVGWKWNLDSATPMRFLSWAARLHEVGLHIAHDQHHKHGAYVLEHTDLPGFSREEQMLLAALVGTQRKKIEKPLHPDLPPHWEKMSQYLAILLRLAVILQRGRDSEPLPAFALEAGRGSLHVRFPKRWLDQHPLTQSDLEQEAEHLARISFNLEFE